MRVPVAYICYSARGEWEDYHETPEAVFTTREEAQEWVENKTKEWLNHKAKLESITKAESGFWQSEQDELAELQTKENLTVDEQDRLEYLAELLNESAHEYVESLNYDFTVIIYDERDDHTTVVLDGKEGV